jgi:hypothetical protein
VSAVGIGDAEGDADGFGMAGRQQHHLCPDARILDSERWHDFSSGHLLPQGVQIIGISIDNGLFTVNSPSKKLKLNSPVDRRLIVEAENHGDADLNLIEVQFKPLLRR